jgi:hypothetical protein
MFKLVVDLEFLDFNSLFSLLDQITLPLFLFHLTQPILHNIFNVLHIDQHYLLNSQRI